MCPQRPKQTATASPGASLDTNDTEAPALADTVMKMKPSQNVTDTVTKAQPPQNMADTVTKVQPPQNATDTVTKVHSPQNAGVAVGTVSAVHADVERLPPHPQQQPTPDTQTSPREPQQQHAAQEAEDVARELFHAAEAADDTLDPNPQTTQHISDGSGDAHETDQLGGDANDGDEDNADDGDEGNADDGDEGNADDDTTLTPTDISGLLASDASLTMHSDSDENVEITTPSRSPAASTTKAPALSSPDAAKSRGIDDSDVSPVHPPGGDALTEHPEGDESQTDVEPLLVVEINLPNNQSERLVCYHGETATQAANRFCQQHQLSTKRQKKLEAILQSHMSTLE